MPGMHQQKWFVSWSFRLACWQCGCGKPKVCPMSPAKLLLIWSKANPLRRSERLSTSRMISLQHGKSRSGRNYSSITSANSWMGGVANCWRGGWVGVAKFFFGHRKKVNFFPNLALLIRDKKIYIGNADVMFKVKTCRRNTWMVPKEIVWSEEN